MADIIIIIALGAAFVSSLPLAAISWFLGCWWAMIHSAFIGGHEMMVKFMMDGDKN